jgi:hypothetical protein
VEDLIAAGHPNPMSYSIEQIRAFGFLAGKRRDRELTRSAVATLLGSRGDIKKVQKLLKELSK